MNAEDRDGDEPGELDALFLDCDPGAFPTTGLATLVGGVAPASQTWQRDFEEAWGTPMPDEVVAITKVMHAGLAAKVLYEWRPEIGVMTIPPAEENLFEQIVVRDQEAELGTGLVEALAGQLYLGTYRNGDSHLASVYGEGALVHRQEPEPSGSRLLHIFDHEEHRLAFETARSVSAFAYFSALCRAIHGEQISESAARQALDRVRDAVAPSWHFRSILKRSGAAPFEGFTDPRPLARAWFTRSLWLMALLRPNARAGIEETKNLFVPGHNPPLTAELHDRWTKASRRLVPSALYCMLRCFFFEDPRLEDYLAIGRASHARLSRDCAKLIDETLVGRRKSLGKIDDLLALRDRFQALGLDPARQA